MSNTIADVADVLNHTLDADAHEMAPTHVWADVFGPAAGKMAELLEPMVKGLGANDFYNPDLAGDLTEITHENVWHIRGTRAPSAFDFGRRVEVLDVMGVEKQLIFPSFALMASAMLTGMEVMFEKWGLTIPLSEIRALGRQGIDEYNDWAARTTEIDPARLRPVAYIIDNGTVDDLLAQTHDLVGRGLRALNVPAGSPPGGLSPAAPELEPFWGYLEENDIPMLLHVGGEFAFMKTDVWAKCPAFKPGKVDSHEIGLEPYSFATVHLASLNYLTVMTLGGVFEKFPRLRFGVIETGATWFGPLAESLDMWARDVYSKRLKSFISMLPSEYLARNVRVTPFNNFEPIELHLERYPHLQDCYCYSTDYPHIEGGTDIKRVFYERIAPLGSEVVEKFFRTNAQLILP